MAKNYFWVVKYNFTNLIGYVKKFHLPFNYLLTNNDFGFPYLILRMRGVENKSNGAIAVNLSVCD